MYQYSQLKSKYTGIIADKHVEAKGDNTFKGRFMPSEARLKKF